MRMILYFLFACFVSTACLIAALGAKQPMLLYCVGFGVWLLFLWRLNRRHKRATVKQNGEQLFRDYMRSQLHNRKK